MIMQFQAKMLKRKNDTITETIIPINPKFEDIAASVSCTS